MVWNGMRKCFNFINLNQIVLLFRYTTLEMNLNSMERIQEYIDLPQEALPVIESNRPPAGWPTDSSGIEVRDLEIRYAQDLDPVLRRVSFEVQPGEKVGI